MSTIRTETERVWTTRALLAWTTGHLDAHGVDRPRLAAEWLLGHVLELDRLGLYMDPDRPATDLERAAFRDLVERAADHEPVDYLIGQTPFYSMWFTVNRSVLVPRPSTETLVEHVIHHARATPGFHHPHIADVGTGSGVIAITLAKQVTGAVVCASDISPEALGVAKQNAERHGVADRVRFVQGHLLDPLAGGKFHYIVSNPPYVPEDRWDELPSNVRSHEPELALKGGADGMRLIRELIEHAPDRLLRPGQLVVEIDHTHSPEVLRLVSETPGYGRAHVLRDHEGQDRVLVADVES